MMGWWVAGGTILLLAILAYRPLRRMFRDVTNERAHELFHLQREMLEAKFLQLARSVDHPKGLAWADCDFESGAHFARHRRTGELVAFVETTVHFDLSTPNDTNPTQPIGTQRQATAIFHYQHGQWGTVGRSLFDITPQEALQQYQQDYEPISFYDHPA
jgi:hypothetical protein